MVPRQRVAGLGGVLAVMAIGNRVSGQEEPGGDRQFTVYDRDVLRCVSASARSQVERQRRNGRARVRRALRRPQDRRHYVINQLFVAKRKASLRQNVEGALLLGSPRRLRCHLGLGPAERVSERPRAAADAAAAERRSRFSKASNLALFGFTTGPVMDRTRTLAVKVGAMRRRRRRRSADGIVATRPRPFPQRL